jgi:hypothetical protein
VIQIAYEGCKASERASANQLVRNSRSQFAIFRNYVVVLKKMNIMMSLIINPLIPEDPTS